MTDALLVQYQADKEVSFIQPTCQWVDVACCITNDQQVVINGGGQALHTAHQVPGK
jgi:hypothetical protein